MAKKKTTAAKKKRPAAKKKTYADYIDLRDRLTKKGLTLKPVMGEDEFEAYYKRLRNARKTKEIKTSAWKELERREKAVTHKQAIALAKAATERDGIKVTSGAIKKMSMPDIKLLGTWLNEHKKEEGLYGAAYE